MYRGCLQPSPSQSLLQEKTSSSKSRGRSKASTYSESDSNSLNWGTFDQLDLSQCILFTNDPFILSREVSECICYFNCDDKIDLNEFMLW